MSKIVMHKVEITTTGSAGAATGSGSTPPVNVYLVDVKLDYHASAPATTDVTITDSVSGDTLLAVSDNKTDARKSPRSKPVDNANSAITNAHDKFPVNGTVDIAVAQCDALTNALVAYVWVEEK